nr:MAG TPA: protein of unknown function (DUF4620) [Microviridae sp.]
MSCFAEVQKVLDFGCIHCGCFLRFLPHVVRLGWLYSPPWRSS